MYYVKMVTYHNRTFRSLSESTSMSSIEGEIPKIYVNCCSKPQSHKRLSAAKSLDV